MTDSNNSTLPPESAAGICSEAVKLAKAELEKAQQAYEKARQEAAEQLQAVRQTTVGDVIDGTLKAVRRHPGAGLAAAAMIGFFLGKLFRR